MIFHRAADEHLLVPNHPRIRPPLTPIQENSPGWSFGEGQPSESTKQPDRDYRTHAKEKPSAVGAGLSVWKLHHLSRKSPRVNKPRLEHVLQRELRDARPTLRARNGSKRSAAAHWV